MTTQSAHGTGSAPAADRPTRRRDLRPQRAATSPPQHADDVAAYTPKPIPRQSASAPAGWRFPALDGLRGIAIVSVMLYHTNWSPRGLFGVDVFFVLSGFMITLLMLRELSDTGRLRVAAFFMRRVKRLVPGLLIMLAAVIAVAWWTSDLREFTEITGQSWWALWQVANWAQIAEGTAYWDATGQFRPLAQMWSLSMMEQFYLVWPFLVLLVWFCCRRHRGAFTIALIVLTAASATVAPLLWDGGNSDRLYLGTDSRAVAFIAGAAGAAAMFWIRSRRLGAPSPGRVGRAAVTTLSVLSLAVVLTASVMTTSYHEPWLYQGGLALVAVAASVFVGTLCFPGNKLVGFFSFSVFRGIGVVSYTIFLLHLPVYWVLQKVTPTIAPLTLFFVGGTITWLLSAFLHHGITERIRQARWRPWPAIPVLVLSVAVVAAASHYLPLLRAEQASSSAVPSIENVHGVEIPTGIAGGRPLVLTLGDSLANDLASMLIDHGSGAFAVVDGGVGGCGIIPATKVRASSGYVWEDMGCPDWRETWPEAMSGQPTDVILVHLGWDSGDQYVDGRWIGPKDPDYRAMYAALLDELVTTAGTSAPAAEIVLMADRPTNGIITDPSVTAAYTELLTDAATRHPRVTVADLSDVLCGTGTCTSTDDAGREIFLPDDVHLSPAGMDHLAPWVERVLADALRNR